jgi:5'-nucleotidase
VKIVLTNDDGIDGPGLEALHRCLADSGQIVIVAPLQPQSGTGHQVTTRTALQVNEIDKNQYSVDGTPADCARIALKDIAPDADWLVAGINPGANLGSDVYNSGTVAAAREAAILGCRSIAVSQYIAKDQRINWKITEDHARPALRKLIDHRLVAGHFWNVNLPHPLDEDQELDYQFCRLDINPHQYSYLKNGDAYLYQGSIHERPRQTDTDVAVCFDEGKISITRIALGTTEFDHLQDL